MSRRTTAILLISAGVAAIVGILIWLWWPYHQASKPVAPVAQPPAYPTTSTTAPVAVNVPVAIPAASQAQVSANERVAQEKLRREAVDFAARLATYSSADEFAGMKQVYLQSSPSVQTYLEAERQKLIGEHAMRGPSWGQTARALSSRIVSTLPLSGQKDAEVIVQVQLVNGTEGETLKTSYKEVVLHFTKITTGWQVDRITWQEFNP